MTPSTTGGTPGSGLAVEAVTRLSRVTALDGVSLRVAPASIHALIGPNGVGKSTLFNVGPGDTPDQVGAVRRPPLVGRRPYEIAGLGVARASRTWPCIPSRRSRRTCCSAGTI